MSGMPFVRQATMISAAFLLGVTATLCIFMAALSFFYTDRVDAWAWLDTTIRTAGASTVGLVVMLSVAKFKGHFSQNSLGLGVLAGTFALWGQYMLLTRHIWGEGADVTVFHMVGFGLVFAAFSVPSLFGWLTAWFVVRRFLQQDYDIDAF